MKRLKVNSYAMENLIIKKVAIKSSSSLILPETKDASIARVGLVLDCNSEYDGKYVLYNVSFAKKTSIDGKPVIFLPIKAILALLDVEQDDIVDDVVEVDFNAHAYDSGWNACGMPEVEKI